MLPSRQTLKPFPFPRRAAASFNNRLVADTLETLWNEKLRHLAQVKEEYQKLRQADQRHFIEEQKKQMRSLAADFPRIWNDPNTSDRDRKRMARLLIEDVTLLRAEANRVEKLLKLPETTVIQP